MFEKPTLEDLREAAQKLGMRPSEDYLRAALEITAPLAGAYALLDEMPDELPPVRYPRDGGVRPAPEDNELGAWTYRTSVKGAATGSLAGRTVALKDNVCLAGTPMMIGANYLSDYVPEVDATVATRLLDAGAEIAGKATCEYFCVSGGSHTSETGPVHNPWKRGHSAGGSSSGSAALVANGDVDMAIGGDQAGSIRIPAALCGIVGLKPTFGLVPYTGIGPLEMTIDTTGPMTTSVRDNATMLQAIAGPDGIDGRQGGVVVSDYSAQLGMEIAGMRIGVVREGFGHFNSEPGVDAKVRAAAGRLAGLGAVVEDVSIPIHAQGPAIWAAIRGDAAGTMLLDMNGAGMAHEGLYVTSLMQAIGKWRADPDAFADTLKIATIFSRYTMDKYHGHYYGKAQNIRRRLRAAYDAALAQYDLLLMPTVAMTAPPHPASADPREITRRSWEVTRNTCPFNVTGHPAISIPCGLADGLPVGAMLIGKHFGEADIYRAAEMFEQSGDWKAF